MAKRKQGASALPLFLILIVLAVGIALLISYVTDADKGNIRNTLTVEAGGEVPDANGFVIKNEGVAAQYISGSDAIDMSKTGKYAVTIDYNGKTYSGTVVVADTTPPQAKAENVTVTVGVAGNARSASDATSAGANAPFAYVNDRFPPCTVSEPAKSTVSFGACEGMRHRMKPVKTQSRADEYIVPGGIHFNLKRDVFVNRTVSRTVIRTENRDSHYGGGGGTTVNSGGFSGHSGKF